ncbi:hypothetical protein ROZALSC1DRAFT_23131 [Rozella allomycis CSF55]|uniref:Uncharacterized protein n=1 Tax=Rozella allomycis (strain CSF55) TaxID=988480 RepID=A0A4P9YIF5_ROZAC|nr:hypothetical protein ROZALSC1DRAFT_23131 [Rozella allomycis CSF55]
MECVLLFRSQVFTSRPNRLSIAVYGLLILRAALSTYQLTTIKSVSMSGTLCLFVADFSIAPYQLALKTAVELIVLLVFLRKAISMYILKRRCDKVSMNDSKKWLSMSFHNIFCTTAITACEWMTTVLPNIDGLFIYVNVIFALSNTIQSILVTNIIDELKLKMTKNRTLGPKAVTKTTQLQ